MTRSKPAPPPSIEICILAGGLSQRMGRDKSKLRLSGRTLLSIIRATAKSLRYRVRVIRRDLVARCGPLGGIFSALKTTRAQGVLFLACDMPFLSATMLEKIVLRSKNGCDPVFTSIDGVVGFPFFLPRSALEIIEKQFAEKQFSLQQLGEKLGAKKMRPTLSQRWELSNLNTPADWAKLQQIFAEKC